MKKLLAVDRYICDLYHTGKISKEECHHACQIINRIFFGREL